MKQKMTYSGYLNIGQHKTLPVTCNLNIEVISEDEWAKPVEYNPEQYINGVRIEGDLFFDLPPIQSYYEEGKLKQHYIQQNVMGVLNLHQNGEKTQFNIVLADKVAEIEILPKQLMRYFWTFLPVGKPLSDQLGIFPAEYRQK